MDIEEKIETLYSRDNKKAYEVLLELEAETAESNDLYSYFDSFIEMLNSEKSFTRIRGFRLICGLAKWDDRNKINANIHIILGALDNNNAISARKCLEAINLMLIYKPELSEVIERKLKCLDLSVYKESMQPLIQKDIGHILEQL